MALQVVGPHEEASSARYDEPEFVSERHLMLYRKLVRDMEEESNLNPATKTAMGIAIRTLARDYVVRLIGDQGEPRARQQERDRRFMANLKTIIAGAEKANLTAQVHEQYVLGLLGEIMAVLESRVGHSRELAGKLKSEIGTAMILYTEKALSGGK
jgi:hypothetical protein